MPGTIEALLVLLFAVLPGVPGNLVYQKIIGKDRKEEQWGTVVRIVGLSLGGLMLFIVLGSLVNAPIPAYLSPTTFSNFSLERVFLVSMSLAFVGHTLGALIVSWIGALAIQELNRRTRSTDYPDTWDKFARELTSFHWVVATMKDGARYAGMLSRADTSIAQDERDLILEEPGLYSKARDNYISTPYKYLFVPGTLVASIGVVADNTVDTEGRVVQIGEPMFPKSPTKGMQIVLEANKDKLPAPPARRADDGGAKMRSVEPQKPTKPPNVPPPPPGPMPAKE
jgi:hypothetical protein